ncbi:hypothetical protein [Methylobacterium longum]|uniref:Uncharacterized protein n=1 Tax=Methylobacterium longum TaxID=767694 RepID=A0ABT8AZG2_9HYPH|nr:hypothetical protein [Methylobacterium longum]MDN3574649.1 hypothetical protein [Methylobacterium longum]GJE13663.1 hypothetical protein FOHLNKBM_4727 [Methylobacterium longum]
MTWLLTFLGWWCIASATLGAGLVFTIAGRATLVVTDVLFSMAGIGVLFLLLARMAA